MNAIDLAIVTLLTLPAAFLIGHLLDTPRARRPKYDHYTPLDNHERIERWLKAGGPRRRELERDHEASNIVWGQFMPLHAQLAEDDQDQTLAEKPTASVHRLEPAIREAAQTARARGKRKAAASPRPVLTLRGANKRSRQRAQ